MEDLNHALRRFAKTAALLAAMTGLAPASQAQEMQTVRADRATPVLPTCGFFDPLRQGPTQPAAVPIAQADGATQPRQGLSCVDPGDTVILDGYFGNSFTGATERVTIIGRRLDNSNTVCVRDECSGYIRSMQDAASRLAAQGHHDAASSTQVVNKILSEIMPGYEEPCIGEDEPAVAYIARATEHCADWVRDQLPSVLEFAEDMIAYSGCILRTSARAEIPFNRDHLGDTTRVCQE